MLFVDGSAINGIATVILSVYSSRGDFDCPSRILSALSVLTSLRLRWTFSFFVCMCVQNLRNCSQELVVLYIDTCTN